MIIIITFICIVLYQTFYIHNFILIILCYTRREHWDARCLSQIACRATWDISWAGVTLFLQLRQWGPNDQTVTELCSNSSF